MKSLTARPLGTTQGRCRVGLVRPGPGRLCTMWKERLMSECKLLGTELAIHLTEPMKSEGMKSEWRSDLTERQKMKSEWRSELTERQKMEEPMKSESNRSEVGM